MNREGFWEGIEQAGVCQNLPWRVRSRWRVWRCHTERGWVWVFITLSFTVSIMQAFALHRYFTFILQALLSRVTCRVREAECIHPPELYPQRGQSWLRAFQTGGYIRSIYKALIVFYNANRKP